MTKQELVARISDKTGMQRPQVLNILETLMEEVQDTLKRGDAIFLRGFGTFSVKHRKAKKARNITAGTTLEIPPHNEPHFKPCKDFKEAVN